MGRRIPVLGYPSLTAACVGLQRKGLTAEQIGDKLGRTPQQVHRLIWAGRSSAPKQYHIKISAEAKAALAGRAEHRGVNVPTLISMIIEAVTEPGPDGRDIIEAVLDDGKGVK